jgi:hypothetical protein
MKRGLKVTLVLLAVTSALAVLRIRETITRAPQ